MTAAFTICSNNYLYKAQVLSRSIQERSEVPVYLFLADRRQETIAYEKLNFEKVIFLEELALPDLKWMIEHYSVVEMNTAIKPFAFRYLFQVAGAGTVYFFDPDVKIYQPLSFFDPFWGAHTILLTPHVLTPIPLDSKFPAENLFLNHGTYNLGFLGLKTGEATLRMLEWWSERMQQHCLIDLAEGYFVDQLWFNLVPLFFKSTAVIEHYGCNMSYWNLHERRLELDDEGYRVNGNQPLIFYHFSHFDVALDHIHDIAQFRYAFTGRDALKILYQDYLTDLKRFDPAFFSAFRYFDGRYPLAPPPPSLWSRVRGKIRSLRHGRQ